MTDRTEELRQEMLVKSICKDINKLRAVFMLIKEGMFTPADLQNIEPKVNDLFKEIEESLKKI